MVSCSHLRQQNSEKWYLQQNGLHCIDKNVAYCGKYFQSFELRPINPHRHHTCGGFIDRRTAENWNLTTPWTWTDRFTHTHTLTFQVCSNLVELHSGSLLMQREDQESVSPYQAKHPTKHEPCSTCNSFLNSSTSLSDRCMSRLL